ncbi:MAG: thiol reductant ABC exporter subunit CydC [Vicinamibacterales bacterium]
MRVARGLARLAKPLAARLAAGALLMAVTVAASVALMGTSAWLIASAARRPPIAALQVAIVGVRFFGIGRGIARYVERLVSHDATLRLLARLRIHAFLALAPLVPAAWRRHASGDLLARLVADVDTVDHASVGVAGPLASAGLVTMLAAGIIGRIDGGAALVTVSGLVLAGLVVPLAAWRLGARAEAARVTLRAEVHARLVDGVQGAADLLAFGAGPAHADDLARLDGRLARAQHAAERARSLGASAAAALADLTAVAVVAWIAPRVVAGDVTGVQLAVAALVALASFEAVAPLPAAIQALAGTWTAATRVPGLDAPPAAPRPAPAAALPPPGGTGVLEVSGLTFTYPGESRPALAGVDLRLEPGRLVALVGESGAGKSTLVQVLLRFYDAPSGSVRLDGRALDAYDEPSLRRRVSWMAQRTDIFTGTLAENLRLARPEADDSLLVDALDRAGLRSTVEAWPAGLGTWIGEQGASLSGGERQRLALARVLLAGTPVVLLDEPASQVDPATAGLIAEQARRLADGHAVLLVSHRLEALVRAVEIVVLEEGRVVERGGFEALLARGGVFRRLLDREREAGRPWRPAG